MNRLSPCILRNSLLTTAKTFVRPHIDYAGITYDKPGNTNFKSKLEILRYDPCSELQMLFKGLMA